MAGIDTTQMGDTVQALYDADFIAEYHKRKVWTQFVNWRWKINQKNAGSSKQIAVFGKLGPQVTARAQLSDVNAVRIADGYVSITPYDYHRVVEMDRIVTLQDYADVGKAVAEAVGANAAESLDMLCRTAAVAGTWVYRYGNVARTSLAYGTTGHKISYANLATAKAWVDGKGIPGFSDYGFAIIIHPCIVPDILADTSFIALDEYGNSAKGLINGEIGKIAGIGKVIVHDYAKLYLSGGKTAQAATTLNGAVAAGDTTATLTSDTGMAVGDYVTVGTLEETGTEDGNGDVTDRAEQVMITAVDTDTHIITIQGAGKPADDDDFGFRYAHTNGRAVTESANVAAIMLLGKESLMGACEDGHEEPSTWQHDAYTRVPGILRDYGWSWYGGFSRVEKKMLRIEVAANGGIQGDNYGF